jgi:hypothetical protein
MEFRRTGQRVDRRRRVMLDERLGSAERAEQGLTLRADDTVSESPLATPSYHAAARADQQKRITDLIPTRFETLLTILLLSVAAIAGVEALYGQYETWGSVLGETRVAALDPLKPASLAGWFSALVLTGCSLMALLIYSIRRHKEDDYRGRYRIWVWAAVVWLLGSMAAAAPVHDLIAATIAYLSGSQLTGNPAVFSTSFYAMALATVVVPVFVDMRQNPLALVTVLAAGVAYLLGAAIDLQLLVPLEGPFRTICLSTARMSSHVLLLLSLLLFARHVYLDAQGAIATPRGKVRRRRTVRASRATQTHTLRVVSDDLGETVTRPSRLDVEEGEPKSTARSRRSTKTTRRRQTTSSATSDDGEQRVVKVPSIRRKRLTEPADENAEEIARLEAIEPHLLTKAQRRRLRKLKKRGPRKAA